MKISFADKWIVTILLTLCVATGRGQKQAESAAKLPPAALSSTPMILEESVVTGQWPNMLQEVNPPVGLRDVSPGQCFRVGVIAKGKDAAAFLKQPQIGFTVNFAGHHSVLPQTFASGSKEVRSENDDDTIAASAGRWCVPGDAAGGEVKVEAFAVIGEKRSSLQMVALPVLQPEKPGSLPFADDETMNTWSQTYYQHPQPAFLVSMMLPIFTNEAAANILQQFVISAMKRDPAAVARLGPQLATADPKVQAIAVKLASEAGVKMKISFELSATQKEFVEKLPNIPNADDLTADQSLFGKLDQLWAIFTATGSRAPVDTVISMLAWRADYEAFQKMQASHQEIKELTPELVHAIAYRAAGWSLASFQTNDPLVADYIAAALADPKTPGDIKKELRELDTNPAFIKQ